MAPRGRPEAVVGGRLPAGIVQALRLLGRSGPARVLVFACIALSLWAFGELAEDVLEGEFFAADIPLMRLARAASGPGLDTAFLVLSALGFAWGVVPADILLTLGLALWRRWADAAFVAVATAGSGLLNLVAKHSFQRQRPALWDSIAPEPTYSFPSAHAMGSATLACVLVVLCWPTRARWPVLAAAVLFVLGVGASRVYLGVHYPSDIAAGWAAALAWTLGVHLAMRGGLHLHRRRLRRDG